MIPLAGSTFVIQGQGYELVPCSQYYFDRLNNQGAIAAESLENGKIDTFEYWDILLKLITNDEPKWDVRAKDFDGREAENGILAFLPPSMQAKVLLIGFQSS